MIIVPRIKILEPNDPIGLPMQLAGFFKFVATRPDGSQRVLADWFPNLITDNGLNRMATMSVGTLCSACSVGTGTAAPQASDTQLQARLATRNNDQQYSRINSTGGAPYWTETQRRYRFSPGVAVGNISEVGVGPDSYNSPNNEVGGSLFSRSLIKDINGNPTTITVLADETLDIFYKLRRYTDPSDVPFSINMGGTAYTGILRPSYLPSGGYEAMTPYEAGGSYYYGAIAFDGDIGTVTEGPSGESSTGQQNGYVNLPYSNNSFYRDYEVTFGLDNGNLANGIKSVQSYTAFDAIQASFTPRIFKNNSQVLKLTFRCGPWSRYTPP